MKSLDAANDKGLGQLEALNEFPHWAMENLAPVVSLIDIQAYFPNDVLEPGWSLQRNGFAAPPRRLFKRV